MKKISFDLKIQDLGYPGSEGDLLFLPLFEGDNRPDKDRLYDSENRKFEIKATLNKSNVFLNEIDFDFKKNDGKSFIIVDPKLSYVRINYKDGNFKIFKNDNSELSTIEFDCQSNSTNQALEKFYAGVMPLLDHLSYTYNVPIYIERVIGYDTKNDTVFGNIKIPHGQKVMVEYKDILPNELKPIFALYREAKNSGSNFYKFLCYFKILEGIYEHIRPVLFINAKKEGKTVKTKKELVPAHQELLKNQTNYIGKTIHSVYNDFFRQEFRNAIAHFTLSDSDPFIVSDYKTNAKISSNITFIEICCRILISNQLEYSDQT